MRDCIFCKIVRREIPTKILEETKNFLSFLDVNPKSKGHTIIIPKKHFDNLIDMPGEFGNEILALVKKISKKRISEGADGFNIIMNNFPVAGQAIMHAHVHIIPRRKDDGVKLLT